jgi:phage terminase Nu1 subunit (DNA packaging protein)
VGTQAVTEAPPLSLRAFARRLGVAEGVVRKAIRAGRLERSVGRAHGQVVIADVDLAEQEWRANRDPDKGAAPRRRLAPTIAEARRRVLDAQAAKLELERALKARELVPVRDVREAWAAVLGVIRTGVLALPTRARQALPHLTVADVAVLERLVREVLEELATARVPGLPAGP